MKDSLDELLKIIPNKYILTVLIAKRARQISEELKFLRQVMARDPQTMAIEELLNGRITYEEEKSK
ncbi:MAG: DNA-directed RNA polymerase subunit omega [Dictyoglomus sp. NZ13-RE01]|nr:MAG: DNA-directed RNA polymerase subunit omega [Dictyoglomus sp. NZ13-RE01]